MSIFIIAIIVIVASTCVEVLAKSLLTTPVSIIGNFFSLYLTENPDIAFSLHLPGFLEPLLIGLALVLFCFLAWKSKKTTLNTWGFGLILGGALSNILDRLADGHVTDYVRIGSFPVFNLPDSAITIGVCLLLLEELLRLKKHS